MRNTDYRYTGLRATPTRDYYFTLGRYVPEGVQKLRQFYYYYYYY